MGNMSWRSLTRYLFKMFSCVFVHGGDGSLSCGFVWQAWSPFNFGSDVDSGEKDISVRSSCKDGCLLF